MELNSEKLQNDITNSLVDTISYCVEKTVEAAGYNSTTQLSCQILEYNNKDYSYRVKYASNIITAYALDTSIVYPVGSYVKLIIPNNTSDTRKYILCEDARPQYHLSSSDIFIDNLPLKDYIKLIVKEYSYNTRTNNAKYDDEVDIEDSYEILKSMDLPKNDLEKYKDYMESLSTQLAQIQNEDEEVEIDYELQEKLMKTLKEFQKIYNNSQ